jgi:hypothetical protein
VILFFFFGGLGQPCVQGADEPVGVSRITSAAYNSLSQ